MKARPNSLLRLLLPTMPLLNKFKLPPPKIGEPLEVATNGVLGVVVLTGVLKVVVLNGVALPLPPLRILKSPPSGLTGALEIAKRKSRIIR